jgi:glycosyltransferase involved in cell wall biosynthesis
MSYKQTKNGLEKSIFPLVKEVLLPNFKKRLYLAGIPLGNQHREPLTAVQAKQAFQQREPDGQPRIYLNLSAVAYVDNRSGIPRVVKSLAKEGILAEDAALIPVYADLETGVFKVAKAFAQNLTGKMLSIPEDIMAVAPGDVFLNVTVNPNELAFEHQAFQAMRSVGVKVFCVVHDLIAVLQPEFSRDRDTRHLNDWLHRIIQYDGIVANSQTTLSSFEEWIVREKIVLPVGFQKYWFHLGADMQADINDADVCGDKAVMVLIRSQTPYFMQVGTVELRKGHDDLLDGFEKLWSEGIQLALVIVGRRGWKVQQVIDRIQRHALLNKLLFWFNNADDAALHCLYRHAEAVVLASKAEGYGLPVAEGAWFGRPLLLRDLPIFQEIAQEGATYFSGNGMGLAEVAKRLHETIVQGKPVPMPKPDQFPNWKQSFEMLKARLLPEN